MPLAGERRKAILESAGQAPPQWLDDRVGVEVTRCRHEPRTRVVALADHERLVGAAVERVLEQPFERGVLLLDDEHFAEADGELAEDARVDRHRHAQVQQADAGVGDGGIIAQAEQAQCLP